MLVLLHYSGIAGVPPAFWYAWKHRGAALHLPREGSRAGRVVDPSLPTRLVCRELQFPSGSRIEAVLSTGQIAIFFAGCAARLEYQCRLEGEHLSFGLPVAPHSLKQRKANGVQPCKGVGLVGFNIHWILLLRNSVLLTFPKRCFNFQSYKQIPTFAIIIYFFIYPWWKKCEQFQ